MKYFQPGKDSKAYSEEASLYRLRDLSPSVPQVIGFATGNLGHIILVLDSVGISFVGRTAPKITR